MKVQTTAIILTVLSELKDYRKELYDKAIQKIALLQHKDGGWPLSLGGRSELAPTIWAVDALAKSNDIGFVDNVNKGLEFVLINFMKGSHARDSNAADWSTLLGLADFKDISLNRKSADELQVLANTINEKVVKNGNIRYIPRKLPQKFCIIRDTLLGLLEFSHPEILQRNKIERFLRTIPSWLKWLISVAVVGIVLGVISNILYNLFFGH